MSNLKDLLKELVDYPNYFDINDRKILINDTLEHIDSLEQQLSNSIPKEAVRELVGEWTEAAKQCEEAGMTSISEWEIVHDLNKLLEGELPPILQKQQGLDGEG